jgi:predicted 3-demethylubiquinone-9 3-methyltransferase (glyoxalase superfamily)
MQKITPYLWFDRNAEEAMDFYTSVFKDGKIISITRYPDEVPEGPMRGFEGKVLTGVFEINGQRFSAMDGGPVFTFSEAVSFQIDCADQAEVDYYWEKLSDGGPAEAQQCGWLKDKFGVSWQVIPRRLPELMNDPDQQKAARVTAAMMQMKKIDIAELERAAQG